MTNPQNCWKCAGPSTSSASVTLCSAHATSSPSGEDISETPAAPIESSTENIDEIVQDHDNFGTDENEEEDSMDSCSASNLFRVSESSTPKIITKSTTTSFSSAREQYIRASNCAGSSGCKKAALGHPSKIGGKKWSFFNAGDRHTVFWVGELYAHFLLWWLQAMKPYRFCRPRYRK